MLTIVVIFCELLCAAVSLVLAILWTRQPQGPYEPLLATCAALTVGFELFRRYKRSSRLRVFLSVGAQYTNRQKDFVDQLRLFIDAKGIERLEVSSDSPRAKQPLLEIREFIGSCDAVVVLAFTRYVIYSGVEKPDADRSSKHKELPITGERHPTVWNQIEAGIAYGLGKPILLIMEEGMKQEAMLKKDRLEFQTISCAIEGSFLRTEAFTGIFSDFVSIVRKRSWWKL